jgi:hypothetical protein
MTFNGRRPQILKVIYLSNQWSDLMSQNQTLQMFQMKMTSE